MWNQRLPNSRFPSGMTERKAKAKAKARAKAKAKAKAKQKPIQGSFDSALRASLRMTAGGGAEALRSG
jgi:hypothetical protein